MATRESGAAVRSLRADARRNLDLILEAAAEVFAEQGFEASVADVAARAGVGTATIFRRFPTKDELVAAVLEQRVGGLAAAARDAAASDDPAGALRVFIEAAVSMMKSDRGFCEAAGSSAYSAPRMRELHEDVTASMRTIVRRAQAAGAVRSDVVAADIPVLVQALADVSALVDRARPGAWRRYLDLVVDGLAPAGATRLRGTAPTMAQLERAWGAL